MIPELEELSNTDFFEEKALIEENRKLIKLLLKKGVKIKASKWTELEAS